MDMDLTILMDHRDLALEDFLLLLLFRITIRMEGLHFGAIQEEIDLVQIQEVLSNKSGAKGNAEDAKKKKGIAIQINSKVVQNDNGNNLDSKNAGN